MADWEDEKKNVSFLMKRKVQICWVYIVLLRQQTYSTTFVKNENVRYELVGVHLCQIKSERHF